MCFPVGTTHGFCLTGQMYSCHATLPLGAKWAQPRSGTTSRSTTMAKHFPKGLDGRMQDRNGQIRAKRADTKIATIREEYGDDVAKGYRGDAQLGTVLKKEGFDSLSDLLKSNR